MMKKYLIILLALGRSICAAAQPVIIPSPASVESFSKEYVPLELVTVSCDDPEAVQWVRAHLTEWYGGCTPEVKKGKVIRSSRDDPEYILDVKAGETAIVAESMEGVRHALYSLRQIAIPKRGTLTVEGWIVPEIKITDSPACSFRGMHICWFRETKAWQVERLIRLAAYYKMNYAVIESWGTFRSDTAPWYGWPGSEMTKAEISRLKGIADDLGIILIPQMNVFGHASGARGAGGKHAVLSVSPEHQCLFEPLNGWNWCLTNPEARKLIISLLREMSEAFGNPPFIHIGCDEAEEPSCPECLRRPYSEIFLEHLDAIDKAVAQMGARPMMWHDMLLKKGDPRWSGFYANGTDETARAAEYLPKDIVICDWFYGGGKESYPTMSYFKNLGYSVLTCPWNNFSGMIPQIRYARENGMYGVLGTTWHHFWGSELRDIYFTVANMAWYGDRPDVRNMHEHFLTHLHHVYWDMHITDPDMTGLYIYDVPPAPILNN